MEIRRAIPAEIVARMAAWAAAMAIENDVSTELERQQWVASGRGMVLQRTELKPAPG
jgi:hypothetical protein